MTDINRKALDLLGDRYCEKGGHDFQDLWEAAEEIIIEFLEAAEKCSCEYCDEHHGLGIYDPEFGDFKECECGHVYERHFDSYDKMRAIGCKYCQCYTFKGPVD